MRIKKGNPQVKVAEELNNEDQGEEKLMQCIMCNCMTIEEYLKRHIRYNHLISKEEIIDKLYNLHYPNNYKTTSTQTTTSTDTSTGETTENGNANSESEDNTNYDYDGNDLDTQDEEDEEKCATCKSEKKVISPVATCCECGKRFHWACVNLTSKPGKDWMCHDCTEAATANKKAFTQDHAYTSMTNSEEPASNKTRSTPKSRKPGPKSKKTVEEVYSEESDDDDINPAAMAEAEYSAEEEENEESKTITPVKLNKIEDLNDMSKGELRELCFTENINPKGTREDLEERLRKYFKKKKAEKEPEKKAQKLTEVVEGKAVCRICGLGWDLPDNLELGPLYKYGSCTAHLHCLMFSSGLIQRGEESDGIIGFLPDDIQSELQRGSKLRCAFCKEIYATVGCCQKSCTKSYHLPCGVKFGALSEYYGNFDSYCPIHRAKRTAHIRPRNYVLTDLGLVPEQVDADSNYDPDRYKAKLKKLEAELSKKDKSNSLKGKKRSSPEIVKKQKVVQKQPTRHEKESEEEEEQTPIQRKKKVVVKKEPEDNVETGRRSGRRIIKKTPGSNIYSSAVDELKKLLAKKQEIKLDETYSDLAGKRRKVTIKKEKDESDDDINWVKPRASRRYAKSVEALQRSDSEDEPPSRKISKKTVEQKRRSKSNHDEEEESVESIQIFLQNSGSKKNKFKSRRKSLSESSEDELPYPKIRKKVANKRISSPILTKNRVSSPVVAKKRENSADSSSYSGKRRKSANESSFRGEEDEDSDSHVDINELIDNLSDEEPRHSSRRTSKDSDSEYNVEQSESSDFEITEKESSNDSEEVEVKETKKSKKEVSFSEEVTEFEPQPRNSKYFNMDELLQKGKKKHKPGPKSFQRKREEKEEEDLEQEEEEEVSHETQNGEQNNDEDEKPSVPETFRTAVFLPNSSDEDEPPPQQNESTDADFDKLFDDGADSKKKSPPKPSKPEESDKQKEIQSNDILNMALEESGIGVLDQEKDKSEAADQNDTTGDTANDSSDMDPFSSTPFKLLFSTFGGNQPAEQAPEAENLSSTLDPDEFLQKHFQ